MGLTGRLEATIEMRASAEKFYELFKTQVYHIPSISSDVIQSVDLHEGEWHTDGAVKLWSYTLGGKSLAVKEKIEVDDENKLLKFNVIEGDVQQEFKSFRPSVQAIAKEDGNLGSLVKWVIEYEKLNEDVKDPDNYLGIAVKVTKDIDDHLVNK